MRISCDSLARREDRHDLAARDDIRLFCAKAPVLLRPRLASPRTLSETSNSKVSRGNAWTKGVLAHGTHRGYLH